MRDGESGRHKRVSGTAAFRRRCLCGRGEVKGDPNRAGKPKGPAEVEILRLPYRGQYRSKVTCWNRFPARLRLVRKV